MEQTMTVGPVPSFANEAGQFLTFTLGDEEYGIDILKVQEIKGYSAVTRIPRAPAYVKGMINLRGTIVPVIDLRNKFGLEAKACDQFTVIIVVLVRGRTLGMIVDTVSDVLNIARTDVQAPPDFSSSIDTSFISGMGKSGNKLIILVDVEKVLGVDELQAIESAQA
jgi:purine-binding chemotaxis protein CheW